MTFVVRIDLVQYTGLDSLVCCELISFCFFVNGSANCFGIVHVMFVVLIFFVVVFECISINIVKWDMDLSSDEV